MYFGCATVCVVALADGFGIQLPLNQTETMELSKTEKDRCLRASIRPKKDKQIIGQHLTDFNVNLWKGGEGGFCKHSSVRRSPVYGKILPD